MARVKSRKLTQHLWRINMPFKIVRNDLTKMQVDVIVNTANPKPKYSLGMDIAVYKTAGEEELLAERKKLDI